MHPCINPSNYPFTHLTSIIHHLSSIHPTTLQKLPIETKWYLIQSWGWRKESTWCSLVKCMNARQLFFMKPTVWSKQLKCTMRLQQNLIWGLKMLSWKVRVMGECVEGNERLKMWEKFTMVDHRGWGKGRGRAGEVGRGHEGGTGDEGGGLSIALGWLLRIRATDSVSPGWDDSRCFHILGQGLCRSDASLFLSYLAEMRM